MKTILIAGILGLYGVLPARSQTSGRFDITSSVIVGGGTTFSSSARFQLGNSIAQPLAAVPASARFSIQGGFWVRFSPIFFSPAKVGTNFVVSIQTDLGQTYTVQCAASLAPQNWQTLTTITGNGAVMTITNSTVGITNRFFRLIEQ